MPLIKKFNHEEVEGVRFGKFNIADNSTAILYRVDDILIDTGPGNQWRNIRNYLSECSVSRVLLTHHHEDHSGNASFISKHFRVPVHVHEKGIWPLVKGFPIRLYQKVFWGRSRVLSPEPLPDRIVTGGGRTLIPIHTPGHSPDHVCFLEPERKWLFAGDLFLATRPKLFREDECLEGEIQSLKTVLNYSFDTVFCSHKGIVSDGHDAIKKKLEYFITLSRDVKELRREGMEAREITAKLFGSRDMVGIISFKHICSENLVNQCLAVDSKIL